MVIPFFSSEVEYLLIADIPQTSCFSRCKSFKVAFNYSERANAVGDVVWLIAFQFEASELSIFSVACESTWLDVMLRFTIVYFGSFRFLMIIYAVRLECFIVLLSC